MSHSTDDHFPAAAFGHFIMKVSDISTSYKFYSDMGLRPCGVFPDLAIIELRGGSHILLFSKNGDTSFPVNPSNLGQRSAIVSERLDLMIDGKAKSDLEVYRTALIDRGLSVDAIAKDRLFGHHYFQLVDPDGNGITVYTSHVGDLPV
jgi:catechol 2,3-dioxygenase-like lactoylglutathione lyase family enzyme